MSRVERTDFRLPVIVIYTSIKGVLQRPVESAQYLSIRYTERLAQAGIDTSVGSVGDSYDNALAESIIGLFKTEVIKFLESAHADPAGTKPAMELGLRL